MDVGKRLEKLLGSGRSSRISQQKVTRSPNPSPFFGLIKVRRPEPKFLLIFNPTTDTPSE